MTTPTGDQVGARISELVQPLWFEIAVPIPGTGDRAVIFTGPFDAAGVQAGLTALQQFTPQSRIDVVTTEIIQRRTPK